MKAKIKKVFELTIGTNMGGKTEKDLIEAALKLEQLGNRELDVRVHIFEKADADKPNS